MAREPSLAAETRQEIEAFLVEQGYDLSDLRDVPQAWQPLDD